MFGLLLVVGPKYFSRDKLLAPLSIGFFSVSLQGFLRSIVAPRLLSLVALCCPASAGWSWPCRGGSLTLSSILPCVPGLTHFNQSIEQNHWTIVPLNKTIRKSSHNLPRVSPILTMIKSSTKLYGEASMIATTSTWSAVYTLTRMEPRGDLLGSPVLT